MTNAPFIVNIDCDMYVNNPNVVVDAMCILVGATEKESVFAQFPQVFYNQPKDDPFGCQMITLFQVIQTLFSCFRLKLSQYSVFFLFILWYYGRCCYVGWQEFKVLSTVDVIAFIDVKLFIP